MLRTAFWSKFGRFGATRHFEKVHVKRETTGSPVGRQFLWHLSVLRHQFAQPGACAGRAHGSYYGKYIEHIMVNIYLYIYIYKYSLKKYTYIYIYIYMILYDHMYIYIYTMYNIYILQYIKMYIIYVHYIYIPMIYDIS